MAYFFVTFIEAADESAPQKFRRPSKKRKQAAEKYRIQYEVIDKLAEFSSTRGDANTGRKVGAIIPLGGHEQAWMETALKAIIRRIAEWPSTSDPASLPWIMMQDLPPLS